MSHTYQFRLEMIVKLVQKKKNDSQTTLSAKPYPLPLAEALEGVELHATVKETRTVKL